MQDNCAPSDTDWDRKVWFLPLLRLLLLLLHLHYLSLHVSLYLPSSDFYLYYCIFYIYINMCTCVHSLPQDSTSSTLSTTSTSSIVARLPSLDSSPPHMSQSPLREEAAVFAIQKLLCRVCCGKEMQDMEWKGALGILLTKPFPSNMYPPPSARSQSQTAQAQNILKLICLAKTGLKFVLELVQNFTHQIFSLSLVHFISNVRLLRKVEGICTSWE